MRIVDLQAVIIAFARLYERSGEKESARSLAQLASALAPVKSKPAVATVQSLAREASRRKLM